MDTMSIAYLSTAMSASQLQSDIGVAVLSKQLDVVQDMGSSMIEALEQSVNPHIGGNIDISL